MISVKRLDHLFIEMILKKAFCLKVFHWNYWMTSRRTPKVVWIRIKVSLRRIQILNISKLDLKLMFERIIIGFSLFCSPTGIGVSNSKVWHTLCCYVCRYGIQDSQYYMSNRFTRNQIQCSVIAQALTSLKLTTRTLKT